MGREREVSYCGRSLAANPKGEVIAEASPKKEEVLTVELDLAHIAREREQEPVLSNLRPELYRFINER